MDASLGFETNRDENHGAAMNDSLTFFAPFVNKYASSKLFHTRCYFVTHQFPSGRYDCSGNGHGGRRLQWPLNALQGRPC